MEKICIVKLRKRIAPSHGPGDDGPAGGQTTQSGDSGPAEATAESGTAGVPGLVAENMAAAAAQPLPAGGVSLTLTPEQSRTLRTDPRLLASLAGRFGEGFQAPPPRGEEPVIQLTFASVPPLRLLRIEEVCRMLQVGKGTVNRWIREGALKCYRFGRLRRLLLDDVLSYLEAHMEAPGSPPQTAEPEEPIRRP